MVELTRAMFCQWYEHMGYKRHGGQKKCAVDLGVTTATVRNYLTGEQPYSRKLDLAMSAIAMNLQPWSQRP